MTTSRRWLPWAMWGVFCLVVLVFLDAQRSPSTFFYDEWGFVQYRRGWSLSGFVQPHVGHLVAIPVFIYRVGFELFGLTHYRPFRVMVLLSHLFLATAVFIYIKRRTHVVLAGLAAAAVALLGSGWQNIFFPFSVTHTLAMALGIYAWILLDRDTRRSDVVASVCQVLAVLTSGLGVSMAIGSAAKFAARREWMRAVRVLAPAAIIFMVWYAKYGTSSADPSNYKEVPRYAVDMLAGGAAGLFGRDLLWGRVAIGIMVGVAASHWRPMRLAVAPLAALVGDVLLVAFARVQFGDPASSRYAYEVAVLLLLITADATASMEVKRPAIPIGLALCVLSVWGNWAVLHRGAAGMRVDSTRAAGELRAVEWARDTVKDDFEADPVRAPFLFAGPYLAAIDDLGSPALTDAQVLAADDDLQQLVDRTSIGALRVFDGPRVDDNHDDACDEDVRSTDFVVAPGAVVTIQAGDEPVEIRLRRIADTYATEPAHEVRSGSGYSFTIPADTAPTADWHTRLHSDAPFTVCAP